MKGDALDPRGLIAEAYRMEGLDAAACRTIFLDWSLGRTGPEGTAEAVAALRARYAPLHPDHPMTAVLAEGLGTAGPRRRAGGAKGRRQG